MRGRRPEPDHRFTFHGSWKRAEHDADGRRSFAAVEQSMSDRFLELDCFSGDKLQPSFVALSSPRGRESFCHGQVRGAQGTGSAV